MEGTDGGVLADAAACLAALAFTVPPQRLVTRLDFEFRDAERLRIGRRILARYVVDWIAAIDDGLVHSGRARPGAESRLLRRAGAPRPAESPERPGLRQPGRRCAEQLSARRLRERDR